MKKSVKILIGVLCLLIVGLVIFIVVDKIINRKDKTPTMNIVAAENNTDKEDRTTPSENKTSDKSDKNEISNTTNNITSTDETKIANAAIRKALKDKNWVRENVMADVPSYEEYGGSEYDYNAMFESEQYFAKITSINGMPAYLVISEIVSSASNTVTLVTYENGKVVCGTTQLEGEYSFVEADLNRNIVLIANDPTGDTDIYKIEGKKYKPILQIECDDIDNDGYADYKYFNNDVECSKEEYVKYLEEYRNKCDLVEVTTKLTDENIDKYVN